MPKNKDEFHVDHENKFIHVFNKFLKRNDITETDIHLTDHETEK